MLERSRPARLGRTLGLVATLFAGRASAEIDPALPHDVDALAIEGLDSTAPETLHELLPRPLPTRMTGAEILELRRRVKNLALFDRVEVVPDDARRQLVIKVRRKTTIAPIVDISTGKTFKDSKLTLGAVEHDIDGHATRLGAKASWSERGLNFSLWLHQHVYRPRSWAGEYDVYYTGSGFRFEGTDAATSWHRNRFGGEVEFLSPFFYGTHFRYEFQLNAYRELVDPNAGSRVPKDGVYLGTTSEIVYDRYTWNDLTPNGFRAALELRPGIFVGPAEPRHEARAKATTAIKLGERTALVLFTSGNIVNTGNANHSGLVGSQQGVRGLPDSLYRTRVHGYANLELRHAIDLGKRWYLQGVVFSDAALFEPMNARGRVSPGAFTAAWSTGVGVRILPTALVDTLLRIDGARLHEPIGSWLVQFGITQYI